MRLPKKIWRTISRIVCLLAVLGQAGCQSTAAPGASEPQDCLRAAQARLDRAPAWDCLPTLDGQCVPLRPFFEACAALWPDCVLYAKFYLWESEVAEIISYTRRGPVSHRVRMYHSILHACEPGYQDDKRTHGDVAEFYDELGGFMGLAVYMGQGVYCPLPVPDRGTLPDGTQQKGFSELEPPHPWPKGWPACALQAPGCMAYSKIGPETYGKEMFFYP